MIEVENLTKSYGPRPAVQGLTFTINKGEVVGFLGPNGAGKSTTMNILACILPATSGSAKVGGFDIFDQSMEIRRMIGYLPEHPPLYQDMVVEDFLRYAGKLRNVPNAKLKPAIDRVLEKCMITEVRNRIIGRLSKGFQQRVGLAQAMVHDPDILILDEPTVGLDPIQIIEIRKLIRELGQEHTIILSSHILPEITQICQRVIIINDGQIAAMDSLEGLTASLRNTRRLELRVKQDATGVTEALQALNQVVSVKHEEGRFIIECESDSELQDEVAQLVLSNRWGLIELKPLALTLEDIFLQLTTEEKGVEL